MASGREYTMMFRLNAELGSSFNSSFTGAKNPVLGLQTEINKLNKAQADISSYQKQQSAVDATRKKMEMLQQQYDNIQKEMTETGDSSASMQNKLIAKQNQIDRTSESLTRHSDKLNTMDASLDKAGISTRDLTGESKRLDAEIDELKDSQLQAARAADDMGQSMTSAISGAQSLLVSAGLIVGIKALYEGMKEAAKSAIAFESAMAGVDKTVDLTKPELAAMADEFQRMSTVIPVSANELASIAEVAGQLGVAKDNVVSFTEVMAKLSTATTMTAEQGATMLAQFANITQMDPRNYERMASTIVDLGNNFATTEQKILDMSQGMAASANVAGMTEADIMGLATAISSLGIESQAGASSASKLISQLYKAVKTGKNLEDFARVAGMTGRDFTEAWGTDAATALASFIQGLNDTERNGVSAIEILDDMGISEVRLQRTMLSLAGSGDLLNRSLETANTAWTDNTALQEEAEKRYGTTESQIELAKNAFERLKVTIGEHLTPVVNTLAEKFGAVVNGVNDWMEKNPELTEAILTGVAIFAIGAAGVGVYTAAVNLATAAMTLMKAAIPGAGWVLGGLLALGAVAAGFVYLKGKIDASHETMGTLSEQYKQSMDEIAENKKMSDLIDEYYQLSGEIGGSQKAVEDYKNKQQELWDAWKSGDIPTGEYRKKLQGLQDEYGNSVIASVGYKEKEAELWQALIDGKAPVGEYSEEMEKVRKKHVATEGAVEDYKKKEEALWKAYESGEGDIDQYVDKLFDLRQEYGFNDLSVKGLTDKQEELSRIKQELRDKSGGLITATDNETAAFDRQVKMMDTLNEMDETKKRAKSYEILSKMSKLYVDAVQNETLYTEYLMAAQEKQIEVETIIGGGYDQAIKKANALGDAISTVWDDSKLTDTEKWQKQNDLVQEAGRLMSVLYGTSKDYSGNPLNFFYDLENIDEGNTKFLQAKQDADDLANTYQGLVFETQQTQDDMLQSLIYGITSGGATIEEYKTLLTEQFSGYENGAQIVSDIMTYVSQATQAAANVSDMGEGLLTTEEQALALQTAIDGTKAKMDELSEAYTKVYDSALQSINGQLKLFEELKKPESTLSSDQMLKTLNDQAAYLDSYTANIKKATDLGVAPELVKQLSDGSMESATYLQTIVNSGNEKITELNTAFGKVSEGKETFASTLADIQTNFTTAMDTLQSELVKDVEAMNLNTEAANSGKSTIQGFIDGAEKMLGPVKTAYAKIAAAAAKALKVELKINSPSEVTTEIGQYTGEGIIQGAISQEEAFRKAMRGMALAGVDAYQSVRLVDALGAEYFERDGKIFTQTQNALTAKSNTPVQNTITLSVSPVYNINGNDKPEAVRQTLAQHDSELRSLVLDIIEDAGIDKERRRYDA